MSEANTLSYSHRDFCIYIYSVTKNLRKIRDHFYGELRKITREGSPGMSESRLQLVLIAKPFTRRNPLESSVDTTQTSETQTFLIFTL